MTQLKRFQAIRPAGAASIITLQQWRSGGKLSYRARTVRTQAGEPGICDT